MSGAPCQMSTQTSDPAVNPQRERILACKRCQYKKLKCSKTVPCTACQKARIECEYRHVDRKRRPASQDHVALLQSRVVWLENFIRSLQNASPQERESQLHVVNFISTLSEHASSSATETPFGSALYHTTNLHVTPDGALSFHGPTSICQLVFDDNDRVLDGKNELVSQQAQTIQNADHVLEHFGIDINADIITQSLILFFKWQYPNFMFVYRDAFLRDHYGERRGSKYWSYPLLLSVCALGSLMLPEIDRGDFGGRCQDAAASIAMVTDLGRPSITAVQTFLCLAFYEIGRGNLSKGWAFSGIAFRMGQDLGFQKDPQTWSLLDQSLNTDEDVEIRRRIYWGCYISDKLISLIFGRPVQLSYNEAEVRELETQPDPLFIFPFRSVGFNDDTSRQYTDISMIPYIKEQIKLAQILELMMRLMSTESSQSMTLQRQNLNSVNRSLLEWRANLAEWASFRMWDMMDQPLKPSIAALHLLYNSCRIALNFKEAVAMENHNFTDQAREACTLAVAEIRSILRRFRKQHGFEHIPLVVVYAIAQAIRTSRAFGAKEETQSLLQIMPEIGTVWALARTITPQAP